MLTRQDTRKASRLFGLVFKWEHDRMRPHACLGFNEGWWHSSACVLWQIRVIWDITE